MKFKKYFIIIGLLTGAVLLIIWKSGIFNISKISLEINNASCVNEQSLKSDLNLDGKNILVISQDTVFEKVANKYPCIGQVRVERQFPHDIKIKIEGRNPVAGLISLPETSIQFLNSLEATPSSQTALLNWSFPNRPTESFLIDETGIIFGNNESGDLPVIFINNQNLKVGYTMDPQLWVKSFFILDGLKKINIEFSKVKMIDDCLQVEANPKIAFSLSRDILKQLTSLQLILQKAKIDGRIIETIDLRFDKPVVIYKTNGKR